MILLIDNYDSFVFNLARYLQKLGQEVAVVRNDAVDLGAIESKPPAAIVLSPGPGAPRDAGSSLELVRRLALDVPILGVCLGHQTIAAAFGAAVVRSGNPMHGRTSAIEHTGGGVFAGVPNPFTACRYHSLIVEESTLPPDLVPTAWATDGTLMALRHRSLPLVGVQFHPEAVLTEHGYRLLHNFLTISGIAVAAEPDLLQSSEAAGSERRETPLPAGPVTF